MSKMLAKVYAKYGRRRYRTGMLLDTGSSVTALSHSHAAALGIRCRVSTDRVEIGGERVPVCYRTVDLHIEDTDCLVQKMRVAVATSAERDLPISVLGSDFLQKTGGLIDMRRGRHAVMCDVAGRDAKPEPGEVVWAKGERLAGRRRPRR